VAKFPIPRVNWSSSESLAAVAEAAPRVPWEDFREVMGWRSGEHVGMIGPTGQGKTTLMHAILGWTPFTTVFATKPKDSSMSALIKDDGYVRLPEWRALNPVEFPKRIVWPDAMRMDSIELQKDVFTDAMAKIYVEGNWTVAIDEAYYMSQILKMDKEIRQYLTQARALGISLVAGTQRPTWVPRELYTSATHLFFWRVNERTDLESIAGIGTLDSNIIRKIVPNLEQYQFLYINTRTAFMARSKAPAPN